MSEAAPGGGLAFVLRLLLGLAVGGVAAFRLYGCINAIEAGRCSGVGWITAVVAAVVLLGAVRLLAAALEA